MRLKTESDAALVTEVLLRKVTAKPLAVSDHPIQVASRAPAGSAARQARSRRRSGDDGARVARATAMAMAKGAAE
ncbi:hypothetical protein D3C83_154050 [compost metagenome]